MAETTLHTPQGRFELIRAQTPADSALRAWSAADTLLLDELGSLEQNPRQHGRVLIVNDDNGALAVPLSAADPVIWNDSVLSRSSIAANLERNGLAPLGEHQIVRGHQRPTGHFDTVVVRVPKTLALLKYQLGVIADCCGPQTRVIGAAMARHIHRSTLTAFEELLGPTTTSRATRKARLIHVDLSAGSVTDTAAELEQAQTSFVTGGGITVVEAPGTFSAGQLDVGSALLLETVGELSATGQAEPARVADLGCGNGVVGVTMANNWASAYFTFLDVSDLAVWAAGETWRRNGLDPHRAAFHTADGFGAAQPASFDVVLTNPPFHQGHALDNHLTNRLLADAAQMLTPTGSAFVVAQRHLNLHTTMRRWFDSVDVISKHPSHVVLQGQ